jgi:hypothetical protein
MDLTVIHRVLYPIAAEYTFLSATHGTFSKIGHISGHKPSLKVQKNKAQVLKVHCALSLQCNKTGNQ